MNDTIQQNDDEEQHDGFNVVAEVSLDEWVDFGYDEHGEYIHLIPDKDNRELRCYRSISEATQENRRIKTTIEDVRFRYYFDTERREIHSWYLTYMEGMTFMSFMDLMDRTRQGQLLFEWSEADGGTMMDDEVTSMESIHLTFTKDNGVERNCMIRSEWQVPTHRMARIEGDPYL